MDPASGRGRRQRREPSGARPRARRRAGPDRSSSAGRWSDGSRTWPPPSGIRARFARDATARCRRATRTAMRGTAAIRVGGLRRRRTRRPETRMPSAPRRRAGGHRCGRRCPPERSAGRHGWVRRRWGPAAVLQRLSCDPIGDMDVGRRGIPRPIGVALISRSVPSVTIRAFGRRWVGRQSNAPSRR